MGWFWFRPACPSASRSVYCDFVTVLRLFSVALQERPQRPLDDAVTGTACGFAAVVPGLCSSETRVAPHEGPVVLCFELAVAAFPGSLETDVVSIEGAAALFARRLRG